MSSSSQAQAGQELEEVLSDEIALDDAASKPGDRVRVSQAWNPPPQPWASLVSVASGKGLLAVAGPDKLVIASTKDVRQKQYIPKREDDVTGDARHLPINALNTLKVPRLSHVAFSADESCLVIASEEGGGLAVYETDALTRGSKDPAFQIATQNTPVRHVLPNPNKEADTAHFFGVVLMNGQLVIASLKSRDMVDGQNGKIFHNNVLSACWSPKGKQIVVGLQDGSCAQIDPSGAVKSRIPPPPQLPEIRNSEYASAKAIVPCAIQWLETHKFFIVYTPFYDTETNEDDMPIHDSLYFIAERSSKDAPFVFSKSALDPCMVPPQGQERLPASHFIRRLGSWDPKVKDVLLVTSTACSDGGSFVQLQDESNYVLSTPLDENRKITIPFSTINDEESSPIGMALDFSSQELAPKPIPSEMDQFPNATKPMPCLIVATTDGILCMWWVISRAAVQQESMHANIVHREGPYLDYAALRLTKDKAAVDGESNSASTGTASSQQSAPATTNAAPSLFGSNPSAPSGLLTSKPASSGLGQSAFGKPATPTGTGPQNSAPTFGQSSFGQPAFGHSAFGKPPTPVASSQTAAPAFGKPSTPGGTPTPGPAAFGMTSALGGAAGSAWTTKAAQSPPSGGATFGSTSKIGTTGGFGSVGAMGANKPSPWTAISNGSSSSQSPFARTAAASSPFSKFSSTNAFAATASGTASPFAQKVSNSTTNPSTGGSFFSNAQKNNPTTSFSSSSFGKPSTPSLFPQQSAGSTATLGSNETSSFGKPSTLFSGTPSLSNNSSGLSGLDGGFKLGSTFKGDGTAKDDLPMPKNVGAGLFGADFLGGADDKKSAVKAEPETKKQPSLKDIPPAKLPADDGSGLPPDPSVFNYKKAQAAMAPPPGAIEAPKTQLDGAAAPLPPDPSTYNHKKVMASLGTPPGAADSAEAGKDVPIAGSPPADITHSQTFSPVSSEAGPPDDGSEEWDDDDDDEDATEDDEEESDEAESDEDDRDAEDEEAEEPPHQPEDPVGLARFMSRIGGPERAAPQSPQTSQSKTKSTTPQSSFKQSYTPKELPPGPILQPGGMRKTEDSPRSPSPQRRAQQQRSVTSPVRGRSAMTLPPQIKATAVPPAKPVEKPTVAFQQQPREKTAAELADEASDRLREELAAPIIPTKEQPQFFSHHDYVGDVDTPGIGGEVEKVFRDVNSMIDTVGLNGRSLLSLLEGHEQLRKPEQRDVRDLDDGDAWTLAEIRELSRVMDNIDHQLQNGKLLNVPETLAKLKQDEEEVLKLRTRTKEMRKQIGQHVDPDKIAERDAAPLSAEAAAQQSELRTSLQNVQKLLAEVEEKATMLRAELSSSQSRGSKTSTAPVPTVEAVERTILKMIAMVQQKSGDIDLLESRIRQLPGGLAALRLADDYEDDLASRLGGSKLLTESPSRRTPPRYPRMAANGDALGASAMFSVSRFQTPPSASVRDSPSLRASALARSGGSALGRSTGSLSGSARKKMRDVTSEELEAFRARSHRRRDVLGALQDKLEMRGPRVVKPAQ
ncbi:hypothetical protein CERZMDRAFT_95470 [Cercospora zeae-maydis SCOH1-5]|uniref:Nucleoporin Nup159/Nup146 N-terminal domain-containing protein n=1 Tax=Cercospora zeae-maydis SCOH1-5 TaxID=717836 RepID=A0A6A6FL73_9PEZI|nr:hypothetical protein CERZMDRAFT_95470 [Cercospora zeae-maydis SCOH1-5]